MTDPLFDQAPTEGNRTQVLEATMEPYVNLVDLGERYGLSPWLIRRWFVDALGREDLPPMHAPGEADRLIDDHSMAPSLPTALLVVGRRLREPGGAEPVISRRLVSRLHHLCEATAHRVDTHLVCAPYNWEGTGPRHGEAAPNEVVIGRVLDLCVAETALTRSRRDVVSAGSSTWSAARS